MLAVCSLPVSARLAALQASLHSFGMEDVEVRVGGSCLELEVGDVCYFLDAPAGEWLCASRVLAALESLVGAVLDFQAAVRAVNLAPATEEGGGSSRPRLAAICLREQARSRVALAVGELAAAGVEIGPVPPVVSG